VCISSRGNVFEVSSRCLRGDGAQWPKTIAGERISATLARSWKDLHKPRPTASNNRRRLLYLRVVSGDLSQPRRRAQYLVLSDVRVCAHAHTDGRPSIIGTQHPLKKRKGDESHSRGSTRWDQRGAVKERLDVAIELNRRAARSRFRESTAGARKSLFHVERERMADKYATRRCIRAATPAVTRTRPPPVDKHL